MLKNHMIVDYLIFVVRNCSDDATQAIELMAHKKVFESNKFINKQQLYLKRVLYFNVLLLLSR